ncbi:helix-turn-helix domain-containing protein [Chelativorans xinjiangense]|uniref:helix-turn-helix domain-containing protein n=1 Tax=Chelativorans xinjiangense TaxID=2681485 RepID=UPI00135A843A|nr:AraC family transcriptional regulator [Chelativorans xinjiangense]
MNDLNPVDCVHPLKTLDATGFRVHETVYCAAAFISVESLRWARICLTLEGGYEVDWGHTRLTCGPASLMFQPPAEVYGARVSDAGSLCLTVDIDPTVVGAAVDTLDFERLNATRRPPPHWLAFQLRSELELGDDLSSTSIENTLIDLLGELDGRPSLEVRDAAPSWLARVQEQIHDEFRRHHTLESLARTAGVHHVHLAREFRRRFGCTVGHYIRQRRIEFGCHRLTASQDSLSEIALDAGFADQSHFTNTFRRLVGISPGAFRARFFAPPRQLPA